MRQPFNMANEMMPSHMETAIKELVASSFVDGEPICDVYANKLTDGSVRI